MSMLSAQMDELRELATRYDELQAGIVRVVRVPLNMGLVLREAADTIWQLRDDLQRAHRENAKLRELLADALGYINHPFDASWTHMKRKEARDSLNDRIRKSGIEVDE